MGSFVAFNNSLAIAFVNLITLMIIGIKYI